MLFNSNVFIYIFFPCLLIIYYGSYLIKKSSITIPNYVLLLFSMIFYTCTSGKYIFLLIAVAIINWIDALLMQRYIKRKKLFLILGLTINIGTLVFYKYLDFIIDNIALLLNKITNISFENNFNIALPVGISFFTFQIISYLIDVYRDKVPAQTSYIKLLLYIVLYPQLVAGPIVRYNTINEELERRKILLDDIYDGFCRFSVGLAKKVLIADLFGKVVDLIWSTDIQEISAGMLWGAVGLYTLQIYFDFSAYSDMAIGMGRMFGFHFEENFMLPYSSKNISEFWRRWHISLSTFFRDYIYIPLGGSRKGEYKTYRNLGVVFLITGIWHGANWTFILWGIYYGIIIIIERWLKNKKNIEMKGWMGNIVTLFIVMMGWLLFRADNLKQFTDYLKILFGVSSPTKYLYYGLTYYFPVKVLIIALFAFIVAVFPLKKARNVFNNTYIKGITAIVMLFISAVFIADATFTPFIYFQF